MIRRAAILMLALCAVAAAQMPWSFESPNLAARFRWNRHYNGTVLDDSFRHQNATASNLIWRASALGFNGTNTTISFAPILGNNASWAVVVALKPFTNYPLSSFPVIYGEGQTTNGNPLIWCSIMASNGYFEIRGDNGAPSDANVTGSRKIVDGRPHVVAFVRRASDCRIYVDGIFDTNVTFSGATMTLNTASIGSISRTTRSDFLFGDFYEARLFVPAVSDSDLLNLSTEMRP